MKYLTSIWNFIINPNNQRTILFIAIVIVGIIFFQTCNNNNQLKQDALKSEINKRALTDSIRIVKNKAGELQAEKNAFVATNKELKDLNINLYNEVQKQSKNVLTLTMLNADLSFKVNLLEDSLRNINYVVTYNKLNDTYTIPWDFNKTFDDKNSRTIEGYTVAKWDSVNNIILNEGTMLKKFDLKFNIVTGLEEKDNNLNIFVKSGYPDLKFDNIEGALIDPNNSPLIKKLMKQKRWTFGPTTGWGMMMSPSGIKFGFFIGVSGQYSLFSF